MTGMRFTVGEYILTAGQIEAMGGAEADARRRALLKQLNEGDEDRSIGDTP